MTKDKDNKIIPIKPNKTDCNSCWEQFDDWLRFCPVDWTRIRGSNKDAYEFFQRKDKNE